MNNIAQNLILASASSGRLSLLESIGITPDKVIPADIDETPLKNENPRKYVLRLAEEKARFIANNNPDSYIIGGDCIAILGGKIIGKANTEEEATKIIKSFSGRRHQIVSAVSVISPDNKQVSRAVVTKVKFCYISDDEIQDYIDSGEWKGKSGCFAIQGRGGGFIEYINGSYSNVVGMPLVETKRLLKGLGYKH